MKDRAAVIDFARVFHQGDSSVFVADDQIEIAVAIPVEGRRRDHLQIHHQRFAVARLAASGPAAYSGSVAAADVLEIREAIQELAAQQIEIAVAVEVSEVRRRPAVDVDVAAAGLQSSRLVRVVRLRRRSRRSRSDRRSRAAGRFASAVIVVGVIPAVIGPVADADDQVVVAVAVVIDVSPHVGPRPAGDGSGTSG